MRKREWVRRQAVGTARSMRSNACAITVERRGREASPAAGAGAILGLQRLYGNRHVARLLDGLVRAGARDPTIDRNPADKALAPQKFDGGFIRLTPKVERFDAAAKGQGEVVIANPSQEVDLGSVTNGERGSIRFTIDAEWDFGNRGQGHPLSIIIPTKGIARLVTLTPFRVPSTFEKADDDKIKFSTTRPTLQFTQGRGASLDKQPGTSADPTDIGGSVTISPSITFQVQTAAQTQGTVNVDLVIFNGSVSEAFQSAVNEVESIGRAYTANLVFKKKADPPPAAVKKLFQQEVFFGVGSDKLTDTEYLKLRGWLEGRVPGVGGGADPISPEASASVSGGKSVVNLFGQASNTGSAVFNQDLARRRAERVRQVMQDLSGADARFNTEANGPVEDGSTIEDSHARRVLIYFEADVAAAPVPAGDIVTTPGGP
jgi:hypothetical protein